MIERHVTFEVYPDKIPAFERLFSDEYRPAMSQMPGFVKVELLREKEGENLTNKYQMVIRFSSLQEAAAWRNSSAHQALQPKLKALYGASQLQVYDLVA